MTLRVLDPELFSVSHDSLTVSFAVADASGAVAAPARVRVDGELRAVSEGPAGTRLVRVEGLAPDAEHRVEIECAGGAAVKPSKYFSGRARTLPAPRGKRVARFASLNDLHFGEPRFGGTPLGDGEFGEPADGFPAARESDGDV